MAHLLIVMTSIAVFFAVCLFIVCQKKHIYVVAALLQFTQHGTTGTVNSTSITASSYSALCTIWYTIHIVYQRISSTLHMRDQYIERQFDAIYFTQWWL